MDIKRLQELSGQRPLYEAHKPLSKEEEEKFAREQGVKDAKAGRKRANASDQYGPYGGDYNLGYDSVKKDDKK